MFNPDCRDTSPIKGNFTKNNDKLKWMSNESYIAEPCHKFRDSKGQFLKVLIAKILVSSRENRH